MRVQLCLSLALYLMQNIEGVHASGEIYLLEVYVPDAVSIVTESFLHAHCHATGVFLFLLYCFVT